MSKDSSQVLMLGTEKHKIYSKHVEDEYEIWVALPYGYQKGLEPYPVVYLLDAFLYFGMVTDMTRITSIWELERFPKMIIVGISYPTSESYDLAFDEVTEYFRNRDLTPVMDSKFVKEREKYKPGVKRKTGGGPLFLRFIEELIPFVESKYRIESTNRALCGHSFGGLFALYALFQNPMLFQKYLIADPSLNQTNFLASRLEEEYSQSHDELPAKVFITMNGLMTPDYLQPAQAIFHKLESRNYKHLELAIRWIDGCNHCSMIAPSFIYGLLNLFQEPAGS